MNLKNMKIPVENNLDEIVGELEKRGYEQADRDGGNVSFVVSKGNGLFYFVGGFDVIPSYFKPTTLAELKEM